MSYSPIVRQFAVGVTAFGSAFLTYWVIKKCCREQFVQKLIKDQVFKRWYDNLEFGLSFVVALFATSLKLYDVPGWGTATKSYILYSSICFVFVGAIFYGRWLKARVAEGEKVKISKLEAEIEQREDEIKKAIASRNWLVEISQIIDVILKEKYERIKQLLPRETISPIDILSVESIQKQILIIITAIHETFDSQLTSPASTLRLGIYFRSEADNESLECLYSWNGKIENCFSNRSASYLKIVRMNGVMSELAKCYHSDEGVIIVPDCEAAVKTGSFQYLSPDQASRIKSMLVYRFHVGAGGADEPWIIYLDTDQPNFFETSKKTEYVLFLERVTKRISYELVALELAQRSNLLQPPPQRQV